MTDPLVYLNGAITPLSEAKVSVLDRGFIFGDGVYEVVPIYGRKLFRFEQHVARLFRNLNAIGIQNPHSKDEWRTLIDLVVVEHPSDDQMVYLQVTRGVAPRGHSFPKDPVKPTVFIMTNPLVPQPEEARANGVPCVTMDDMRWLHCDIKSISLLGNVLAAQFAAQSQANETIQFRDGCLTEGSSSNVWIVKDGKLMGPPKDNLILEGIRYGLIEELCAARDIPFEARRITREEVFGADEVILSSATKEVLPATTIDGRQVGNGKPGPVYRKLYEGYQLAKAA